jgi:hypothetical protein
LEKMWVHFFVLLLIPGAVYTFADEACDHGFNLFQVICKYSGQEKLVMTSDQTAVTRNTFSLQKLGVWMSVRSPDGGYPPTKISVHFDGEPCDRSLAEMLAGHELQSVRTSLRHWSMSVSDTEGCVDLSCPKSPGTFNIEDEDCPVLLLLDELKSQRWTPVSRRVNHEDGVRDLDDRKIEGRSSYLRCLLRWLDISVQLEVMPSNGPIAFYDCLLVGKVVPFGLKAKASVE